MEQALLKAHAANPDKSDWITSIQAAFEVAKTDPELKAELMATFAPSESENVVSINAGRKTK